MKRYFLLFVALIICISGCSKAFVAKPVAFKMPSVYGNAVQINKTLAAAEVFNNGKSDKKIFGFDIHGAGMLPVQVVFQNTGYREMQVIVDQTFLEETNGNMWEVLTGDIAKARATQNAQDKKAVKEAGKKGMIGAGIGAVIGALIGTATGSNVAESVGKGAAIGAGSGAVYGSVKALEQDDAAQKALKDFKNTLIEGKPIKGGCITRGFLFFRVKPKTKIVMVDTERHH
ncbi:MAG: lipoprotein [Candidatus Magnetoglobus multicellularis str. Araruama]|uniref:Lipoprotein n=1 Tax=Candidatus Magnetoglobus multicellularis str. Araruama TaxID=890399 RepID=A0A1V1NXE5_9BACT|nr:MAG: lipoprotein [Candidatus Magnetoglobus multicellularis str. Araruama]